MRRIELFCLTAALLVLGPLSQAITITSGPVFVPSTNAPLAGLLQLTTDVDSRVRVQVSDGTNNWEKDFFDFGATHAEVLLGFRPNRTNQVVVTCFDKHRNASAPQNFTFITAPLPAYFPTTTLLTNRPDLMEPGYTLFNLLPARGSTNVYLMALDANGQVAWYRPWTANDFDVRQLNDGNLFMQQQNPSNNFIEMDMQGNIVRTVAAPAGFPVNSHDGVTTDHGTILYLSDVTATATNFPSSTATNASRITARIDDNPVVEISATNGALIHSWSPMSVIEPNRITWLTFQFSTPYGVDNEHGNAVLEDTNDDSLIVSLRDQNAVYKISRSGELKWILGPPANWGAAWQPYLLTPVGSPFDWNYGQHAPELTPQGTLVLYNDNNDMSSPPTPIIGDATNQSSAIEYAIDETNMTVSEVWNSSWQTNQDRLYTFALGKSQRLPQTANTLVTYGIVSYVNEVHPSTNAPAADMVRLVEYTHDPVPQVVFDLSVFDYGNTNKTYAGYLCYRSYRIPDLYPHPAIPVEDLDINFQGGAPYLRFSCDPTHSYDVQSSTDLINWTTIGSASSEDGLGEFGFSDTDEVPTDSRYYRVITN
jgi:arylsulfate sulfotransferase